MTCEDALLRRPFIVSMLVPIELEVLAIDGDEALVAANLCRFVVVGGLALQGSSSGFPQTVSVRTVTTAKEPAT